jgi:hypothetical protein
VAILDIVDDISAYQVPLGAAGEAAVYTEHFHELSLLRKIRADGRTTPSSKPDRMLRPLTSGLTLGW